MTDNTAGLTAVGTAAALLSHAGHHDTEAVAAVLDELAASDLRPVLEAVLTLAGPAMSAIYAHAPNLLTQFSAALRGAAETQPEGEHDE